MSVADSGAIQINETAEPPIVKYDIRQAIITMQQRIVTQFVAMLPHQAIYRFGVGVPVDPREEGTVRTSLRMIPLHCRQIVFRTVRHRASGWILLMQHTQPSSQDGGQTFGLPHVKRRGAVVTWQTCRRQPVIANPSTGYVYWGRCSASIRPGTSLSREPRMTHPRPSE